MKEQIIFDNINLLQSKRIEDGLEFRKCISNVLKLVTFNKSKLSIYLDEFQIMTKEEDIIKSY